MDENVKPGDGKPGGEEVEPEKVSPCCHAAYYIGKYFLFILAFPFLVVFYIPVHMGIDLAKAWL